MDGGGSMTNRETMDRVREALMRKDQETPGEVPDYDVLAEAAIAAMPDLCQSDYLLMVESIDHMKITPKQKEFVRAAMRCAIEYVAMKKAGFELDALPNSNGCGATA